MTPSRRFELLDLSTGTKFDVPNASGFQFSKGSAVVAIKMNGTPNDTSHRGTDLLIRRLATGVTQNIGNVAQYDFDDAGQLLAYTVDAAGRLGNGVYVVNLASGAMRALDSGANDYDGLTWGDGSTHLAALRGEKREGKAEKQNVLLAWTDAGIAAEPDGRVRSVEGRGVPEGLRAQRVHGAALDARTARAVRRHQGAGRRAARDDRAEGECRHLALEGRRAAVGADACASAQERRATFASAVTLASKILREAGRRCDADGHADGRRPLGHRPRLDAVRARLLRGRSRARADYYRDRHGDRRAHADRQAAAAHDGRVARRQVVPVPRGQARDGLQPRQPARRRDVDAATGASFIDTDDDHAAEKPIWGLAGWAKDGKSVLLYDKYDLWSLPLDGSKGRNLTAGAGAAPIRSSCAWCTLGAGGGGGGRGGGGADSAEAAPDEGVDLSQPQTLTRVRRVDEEVRLLHAAAGGGKPTPLI